MGRFVPNYRPVHKGVSIVGDEAYQHYKNSSEIRNPKNTDSVLKYRRLARKIWKEIADSSVTYESGFYDKDFFYLVPQVVDNKPFVELPNGKIKTNNHTNGDIYYPIFCNLFENLNHFCWSLDGTYVQSYMTRMHDLINKFVPKYYFILSTLRKNEF